jgi:hypothetical protein
MTVAFPVRTCTGRDFVAIRALLSDAGLPTLDIDTAPGLRFWVAEDGLSIAGQLALNRTAQRDCCAPWS